MSYSCCLHLQIHLQFITFKLSNKMYAPHLVIIMVPGFHPRCTVAVHYDKVCAKCSTLLNPQELNYLSWYKSDQSHETSLRI